MSVPAGAAEVSSKPVHLDKSRVSGGCSACHYRSYLKSGGGIEHCLYCHGSPSRKQQMNRNVPTGVESKVTGLKDVEQDFSKNYRHPVFEGRGLHRATEQLPERDPKMPRHVECVDCHNPHHLSDENKYAGLAGGKVANQVVEVLEEKDLCYRCHAESANLPVTSTNKKLELSPTNPSYHPVEAEGKNQAVVSLISPYKEKKVSPEDVSRLTCSSCHGSDSTTAGKGPHGSTFEFILVDNYSARDLQNESSFTYALCYKCHSRESILGNESFKYHSLHINGKKPLEQTGTSCFTCHSAHGSTENKYLIRFNQSVVKPNAAGKLQFVEKGTSTFSGECFLNCHNVDHAPKAY